MPKVFPNRAYSFSATLVTLLALAVSACDGGNPSSQPRGLRSSRHQADLARSRVLPSRRVGICYGVNNLQGLELEK